MEVGQIFDNRYQVDAILHRGPKAIVAAASHLLVEGRVAIKLVTPAVAGSPELVNRLINEAQYASKVRSRYVVRVFDLAVAPDRRPYLIMELLEGRTLADRDGPFEPAQAVELAIQLCEGVAEIHRMKIVHRNLEPSNVIVTRGATGPEVRIIDLFFGRTIGTPAFAGGGRSMIGTPPYASPEQLLDPTTADERSDIWSLGVMLATMIANEPPFAAHSFAELVAKLCDGARPKLAPTIPAPLAAVVTRCLARDPSARYASAAELAVALGKSL